MLGVVALNLGYLMMPKMTSAAGSLTAFSDTVSNLTASTAANHTIVFTTPTGVASGATIILTFNNSTNTGSVAYTDVDLQDNGSDVTLAAAPSGATWGFVNTPSTVLTFTNGTTAVTAGHVITIKIGTNATFGVTGVNRITNGTAGSTILRISGTFSDYGSVSMAIVANSIVVVSAEVLASLSFTVSSNSLYFGNLSSSTSCFAQNSNPGYVTCPTTAEAEAFEKLVAKLQSQAMANAKQSPFKLTETQKELYTTVGGTPHLDGNYTVFGEVIEGLSVLDSIAAQHTGPNDRPVRDIRMEVKVIRE